MAARMATTPSACASEFSPVPCACSASSGSAKARARISEKKLAHGGHLLGLHQHRRVADAVELHEPGARAALRHRLRRGGRQQIAVCTAQQQRRQRERVPGLPQQRFAGLRHLRRHGLERQGDRRVGARLEDAGFMLQLRLGQRQPLRARVRAEALRNFPQRVGGGIERRPLRCTADIAADARYCPRLDGRADVVDDEAAQRRVFQRGNTEADQAAHRRADPIDGCRVQARQQRHHVGHVLRDAVVHRVSEPPRSAAANDVGADHAVLSAQRARQRVEVTALARQAVHADQQARVGGITPLPVRHAVQAAIVQTLHMVEARLVRHDRSPSR
jgi:hypothetical protein